MASLASMRDVMRGLLKDPQDVQLPVDVKYAYLAAGVDWLYDDVWTGQSSSVPLADSESYAFVSVPPRSRLVEVRLGDVEATSGTWDGFRIATLDPGFIRLFVTDDAEVVHSGETIFASWVVPFTVDLADGDAVIAGLSGGAALAATFYAMSLASVTGLEDRMDYTRYSTTGQNGVGPNDIIGVGQFWLERAERQKATVSLPLPPVLF